MNILFALIGIILCSYFIYLNQIFNRDAYSYLETIYNFSINFDSNKTIVFNRDEWPISKNSVIKQVAKNLVFILVLLLLFTVMYLTVITYPLQCLLCLLCLGIIIIINFLVRKLLESKDYLYSYSDLNESENSMYCKEFINTNLFCRGNLVMPHSTYINDAENIKVQIDSKYYPLAPNDYKRQSLSCSVSNDSFDLHTQLIDAFNSYLEVEILAAGIIVDGQKIQKKKIRNSPIDYCWNCFFKNSGIQKICFIFRVVTQNKTYEVGMIEHQIKVYKFFKLTQRQVWVVSIIGAIVSFCFTIIKILGTVGLI